MKSKTTFFLLTFSLLFVLVAGIYASFYSTKYYSCIAYGPDPLDGLMRNERAYYNVETNGRISAFIQEFEENNRSFFTIAPLIILAPEILRRPDAHLFISIPLIFLFVFLLSYCTWMRTGNTLHASVLALFYITCYAVTEPYFGIGFNMPDTIAGYSVGVAALSLLIWSEKRKNCWLIMFAVFMSVSVLMRYIFSIYTFLLFSFPLGLILIQQYRRSKNTWQEIAKDCLIVGVVVGLLCGYYVISHFNKNMEYYSYWLHSKKATMNVSVLKSADGFLFMYSGFLRKIHAIFLILLFVANFYFFKIDKKIFKQRLLIASWMFLIIPFYWVVILKTNGRVVGSAFMAAFPVMFISLGLPLNNIIIDNRKKIFSYLLITIIAASLIDFGITLKKNSDSLASTYTEPESTKLFSIRISEWFNTISPRDCTLSLIVFSSGYIGEDISLESFYRNGRYIKTRISENKFRPYSNFYNNEDPYTDIDMIKNSMYQKAVSSSNLLIFFRDGLQLGTTGFDTPISRQVERRLFEKFSTETSWKMIQVPDSSLGHLILFYRNYLNFPNH